MSDFSDPMDFSLLGSSVDGILQARVLEWGAVAFSAVYEAVSDKLVCGTRVATPIRS